MRYAFLSEWIKLRRKRLLIGTYLALAAVAVLGTVLTFATAGHLGGGPGPGTTTSIAKLASSKGISEGLESSITFLGIVTFAVAAAQLASEYSLGTLRVLLVRQSHRQTLLAGKFIAVVTFMLGGVLAATVASVLAAVAMAHAKGIPTTAWITASGLGSLGTGFGDIALAVIGFATLGMTLAVFLRSPIVTIVVGIVFLLIVEQILAGLVTETAKWLPGQTLSAVAQGGTSTVGYTGALGVSLVYVIVAMAVGTLVFCRRDISA
jgi:ABC-type transport system involved in multi-copper enzyme maturation permease subunit